MDEQYRAYLNFVRSMSRGLESLTVLNEKKLAAAQADDLMKLNELLNQEQAQALNIRGLELTRDKLALQLGLQNVPLSQVSDHFPPALQPEARQAVGELQGRYRAYQGVAGKTRNLLEQTLREIEGIIVQLGGSLNGDGIGPGYVKEPDSAPPPSMKTDFRA